MSAETKTILEAAALMRERAKAAAPGPWTVSRYGTDEDVFWEIDTATENLGAMVSAEEAAHVASWDPDVTLAVADLLERVADEPWCCDECKFSPDNSENLAHAALAAAHAYLREKP